MHATLVDATTCAIDGHTHTSKCRHNTAAPFHFIRSPHISCIQTYPQTQKRLSTDISRLRAGVLQNQESLSFEYHERKATKSYKVQGAMAYICGAFNAYVGKFPRIQV